MAISPQARPIPAADPDRGQGHPLYKQYRIFRTDKMFFGHISAVVLWRAWVWARISGLLCAPALITQIHVRFP